MSYQLITDRNCVFTHPRPKGHKYTSITIHHWDDPAKKPTFEGTVNWLARPGNSASSVHYVAEAGKIACLADPDTTLTWHAGDGAAGQGNNYSISIECNPRCADGDYATVAELIRELRAVYGDLPLRPHRNWTTTACPGNWDLARLDVLARQGKAPVAKPAATAKPKPKAKSISQLADEVIAGKHGSGDARKRALGSKYAAVQAEVNRRLLGSAPKAKSISQLADEVIAGKHGNGADRQRSLGSRYAAVQAEVNRRFS